MKLFAGMVFVAVAAAFSPSTEALDFKCACLASKKAALQTSVDPKISCVETYSDFSSKVSVQEAHLKIYVGSGQLVQGDNDTHIRFRPRDQKCLTEVDDGNALKPLYGPGGLYCDNDDEKEVGLFKIRETQHNYSAGAAVITDGKQQNSFLLYGMSRKDPKDPTSGWGPRKLDAVCVQAAGATTATCSCRSSQKAGLDTSPKLSCASTFSDTATSAMVTHTAAKLSARVAGENMSRTDGYATPQFKPAPGSCINYVADSNKKELFKGQYCIPDTVIGTPEGDKDSDSSSSEWKAFGSLTMDETGVNSNAALLAKTTGKHYKGAVLYGKNMETSKWEAAAVCIENR
jgi:hypothetical protein